jgi:uncharacterized protein (DUF697 family)
MMTIVETGTRAGSRETPDALASFKLVSDLTPASEAAPETPKPSDSSAITETAPIIETSPIANDTGPTVRRTAVEAGRRRTRAYAIVNRHAIYASVGGVMPVPLMTFAGCPIVVMRMIKALSNHYGVPFERDRAQAIVLGMTGSVPTGFGAIAATTFFYMLPISFLIGSAVSAALAAAATRGIGRVFVEHFETGASLIDFPVKR